eukprot:10041495-Lingulodinium_polyedra.AAC.1
MKNARRAQPLPDSRRPCGLRSTRTRRADCEHICERGRVNAPRARKTRARAVTLNAQRTAKLRQTCGKRAAIVL